MLEYPHIPSRTMINLDERYHSYLDGSKKMRIDGTEERVKAYGWNCDGNDITGHYVTTENHKLYYDMQGTFMQMKSLEPVVS
mgnify:FL=1|tara:strand:+ start:223 stop:468 length:246 start_codon:yes stop_codon:yes gene_type:complete